jgi:hypothetical protein
MRRLTFLACTNDEAGQHPSVRPAWSCCCLKQRAPDRIRTCNLLIRSQMLYPLSYGRVPEGFGSLARARGVDEISAVLLDGPRWGAERITSVTEQPRRSGSLSGPEAGALCVWTGAGGVA